MDRDLAGLKGPPPPLRPTRGRISVRSCGVNDLDRIEAALQRMNGGSYGYCIACGAQISLERLVEDPATEICDRCRDDEDD